MRHIIILLKSIFLLTLLIGFQKKIIAQEDNSQQLLEQQLRVYYVEDPNNDDRPHPVRITRDSDIFGGNPDMEHAQTLIRAIFGTGELHDPFREQLANALSRVRKPLAIFLYNDIEALEGGVSEMWINCIKDEHLFSCATVSGNDEYVRIIHYGANQLNNESIAHSKAGIIRLLSHSRGSGGWWDAVNEGTTEEFEVCVPFVSDYEEFRSSVVANSEEIRYGMISRSNPEYAEEVIDRRPFLREIHHSYLGTLVNQEMCLRGVIVRDSRDYVAIIRFEAVNGLDMQGDSVVGDTSPIQERELNTLKENFDALMDETLDEIPTFFGSPDSHDITLSSVIHHYCNNLIRLSRGQRTMVPAYGPPEFVLRPYIDRATADWNNLTSNSSNPALRTNPSLLVQKCQSWARTVLREHGNTTDASTIENFVSNINGYRNY